MGHRDSGRYVLDCFDGTAPLFEDDEGDAHEFFETEAEARKRAAALLCGGRFHRIILRDCASGEWNNLETWVRPRGQSN